MQWYKDLSFRQKLVYPSLILILVIAVTSAISIANVDSLEVNANKLANENLPNQDLVLQADKDLVQVQAAERSILFLDSNSARFNEQVKLQEINLSQAFGRVSKVRSDNAKLNRLKADFLQKFAQWKSTSMAITEQLRIGTPSAQAQAVEASFGKSNNEFRELRDMLDEVIVVIVNETNEATEEVQDRAIEINSLLLFSAFISLAVSVFFITVLPNMVTHSLNLLQQSLLDINRGDGDLTKRINSNSNDEAGQLSQEFNKFLDNLHNIISKVASSTNHLSNSTQNLTGVSVETQTALEYQKRATESVASATSQMNVSVQDMASSATEAAQEAKSANDNAVQGQKVIQHTIAIINELSTDMTVTQQSIEKLASDSQNIGRVLDVIESIAEQTNLLALNAAIEAARAGEQGRGFAVVADEVRSLAAKTQVSTEEIKSMIESLQKGSNDAVSAITVSNEKMTQSADVVASTDDSLQQINHAVTAIFDLNTQISEVARQQSGVTEEINANVQDIVQESDKTLDNAKTVAHSSNELATLAAELSKLVGNFKL